jgi:hypothetical protein
LNIEELPSLARNKIDTKLGAYIPTCTWSNYKILLQDKVKIGRRYRLTLMTKRINLKEVISTMFIGE